MRLVLASLATSAILPIAYALHLGHCFLPESTSLSLSSDLQAAEQDPTVYPTMGTGSVESQIWPQACANSSKKVFVLWLGASVSSTRENRTQRKTISYSSLKTKNQMRPMKRCLETNWVISPVAWHKCRKSVSCHCGLQIKAQVPWMNGCDFKSSHSIGGSYHPQEMMTTWPRFVREVLKSCWVVSRVKNTGSWSMTESFRVLHLQG